jgi:hypothetical protein
MHFLTPSLGSGIQYIDEFGIITSLRLGNADEWPESSQHDGRRRPSTAALPVSIQRYVKLLVARFPRFVPPSSVEHPPEEGNGVTIEVPFSLSNP